MLRAAVVLVLLVAPAVAPLAASGGSEDGHVHISGFAYSPTPIILRQGEVVGWDNHDLTSHTVTADDGTFDSGTLANGEHFQFHTGGPASIAYHCRFHAFMHGTVEVVDPRTLPDLVVGSIEVVDETPGVKQVLEVKVHNVGGGDADPSTAKLYYRYEAKLHEIGTISVPALEPDATSATDLEWSTLGKVGDFKLVAQVDVEDDIFEGIEGNNEAQAATHVLVTGVIGKDVLDGF